MGVITKGAGWWLAYMCLPTQLLCYTLLWKPFESWFLGMQLCLCLPVHHHRCVPSYVWPFQKCVDMFRNKLCDVKITYWVGNKQISPKRAGPLKAMRSSCWGLDAQFCSAELASCFSCVCRTFLVLIPAELKYPVCVHQLILTSTLVVAWGKVREGKWVPLPLLLPQGDWVTSQLWDCCCSWETTLSWTLAWGFTPEPPSSPSLVNLCGF